MLQRKKPLTRKAPLRAKKPMRPGKAAAATQNHAARDDAIDKLRPLLAERSGPPFTEAERLGTYRADFYCPAARLVILVGDNDEPERQDWFESQGYRVLAFATDTIRRDPESIVAAVDGAFTLRVIKH